MFVGEASIYSVSVCSKRDEWNLIVAHPEVVLTEGVDEAGAFL